VNLLELWVYPIKGCRGIALPEAPLAPQGFLWDRHWMLVDEAGRAITQREAPQLVCVATAFESAAFPAQAPTHLRVSATGVAPLVLALADADGPELTATLFDTKVAVSEKREGSRWFSQALGRRVRLVTLQRGTRRLFNPKYALPSDHLSLADGYPVTLASMCSMHELNEKLERRGKGPAAMRNFRPNLVIDGTAAFCEDTWPRLTVGAATLRLAKRTARCMVVNVAEDGSYSKEPLATLASFRSDDHEAYFAVNLIPELGGDTEIMVAVGDKVLPAI
jgi:uncharacterized protein